MNELNPNHQEIYPTLLELRRDRVPCALCTVVSSSGSAPRTAGAKMIVRPEPPHIGTVGGGAIEHTVISRAQAAIASGEPDLVEHHLTVDLGMACGGSMKVYVEPQVYAPRMIIFGAGHCGQAVADMAATLGFEITVVDARAEWATEERYPRAKSVLCQSHQEAIPNLPWASDTYVLIMTHSHDIDYQILREVLGLPLAYLGVIASLRKRETFRQDLRSSGIPEELVTRFHSPLGLDIGAVTPAEIAVSVLAEIVQVKRGRKGREALPMSLLGHRG